MARLTALIVLTAAFAPAAVMGALPLVAPVVVLLLGVGLGVSALQSASVSRVSPTPVTESADPPVPSR